MTKEQFAFLSKSLIWFKVPNLKTPFVHLTLWYSSIDLYWCGSCVLVSSLDSKEIKQHYTFRKCFISITSIPNTDFSSHLQMMHINKKRKKS